MYNFQLATEAIENIRAVQYLASESHFHRLFIDAMHAPYRRALIRSVWQSVAYAMSASFIMLNFASAYRFGLFLIKHQLSTPFTVFQSVCH
jgi:ATP-binding cassette subfamily B (MDR/TAP) protein 1